MFEFSLAAAAQNLVISNARIIDGIGKAIDHGSVLTRGGKITATAIGKSSESGILEAGKRADIVIVDGDPLEDVFNLTRVILPVKDG